MKNKFKIFMSIGMLTFLMTFMVACDSGDNSSNSSNPNVAYEKIELSEGINSLEDQLSNGIEIALNSTLCVYNYQRVRSGNPGRYTYTDQLYSTGSGVIYYKSEKDSSGQYTYRLITNEHVIDASSDKTVTAGYEKFELYYGESTTLGATLLGSNAEADIAVLEFKTNKEFTAATLAKSSDIKVGKFVIAVGTPLDIEYYNTVTLGIISRITETSIQHDAAINSGNSGGPLFNIYGQLVGINNSKLTGQTSSGTYIEGMLFAISLSVTCDAVNEIVGNTELVFE